MLSIAKNKMVIGVLAWLIAGGLAAAQTVNLPPAGITPASPLFFLDRFFESLGDIFTFGQVAKAKRAVTIAEERLSELKTLVVRSDEKSQQAVELYEEKMSEAMEHAQNAQNADALARVIEAGGKHLEVLEEVIAQVPAQAQTPVKKALESSSARQILALRLLKEKDPAQAAAAGISALKAQIERVKINAEKGLAQNAETAADNVRKTLEVVSNAVQGNAALAEKFSKELRSMVANLDQAKRSVTPNTPKSVREKISDAKSLIIDAQISSLKEVLKENPRAGVEILAQSAEDRLSAVKQDAERKDEDAIEEDLEDYKKYAEFGSQISILALGIKLGETAVEDLVKRATAHHLEVLEDISQKLPPQARDEFQQALESARKVQRLKPGIVSPQTTPAAPLIKNISPSAAHIGAKVSIIGSGFTPTKNSLQFGSGFGYINNLTSPDGRTIIFTPPEAFDTCNPDGSACAEFLSRPIPGQTYEVSVINANGRSNSVSFTVSVARGRGTAIPPISTSTPPWVPYTRDGLCPPGYVNYGVPLQCVTPEYWEYCQTHPCPICLAGNSMIDTPQGLIPVKNLQVGMPVWTTDKAGNRVLGIVIKTSKIPAPPTHQMVRLVLDDGRELYVSPGHPTVNGRTVGDLAVGELYDGSYVISTERVSYDQNATYDILPSGETGFYWANGILLDSTLH
jgi:hypothetical protein